MNRTKTIRVLLSLLLLATTLFIWGNSLLDGTQSSQVSGGVRELLVSLLGPWIQDTFFFEYIRKFGHFCEFALLGLEWSALTALNKTSWRPRWWLLAGPLTAACDELLQFTSPGRAPAVTDVCIDSAGFFVGAALVWAIVCLRRRRARS